MAEISLRGVGKTYHGGVTAVKTIETEIADGEFIVIVGPSGCGKSTLLRMIAGLETITDGEIIIGGTVVNQLEPAERDVAMVFQNYALYPHMTVYANMAYALKIRGFSKEDIDSRVKRVAEILELTPFLARKPRQLSGGQRQRVAMGRSIVRQPKVFLFDEPLSNLDAKLRLQMRIELKKLHLNLKTTSVYVTHDQVEAMTLGNRLIVMNQGCAEQIGTPLEIYQQPASRFVAGFIGSPSMNFMEVSITADGQWANLAGGERLPVALQEHGGKQLVMGIRPEDLSISQSPESQATILLQVDLVEALGADTLIHGKIDQEPNTLTCRLTGIHTFERGATLALADPGAKKHFFDRESGLRLPS